MDIIRIKSSFMIQLTNISKSYGEQDLFFNLDFRINKGNKIGFVGRNGSGKSTLFKIILGEESYDTGELSIPKAYKIASLKQHLEFTQNTILDEVSLSLSEDDKYFIYKVEKILFGLGFSSEDLNKHPNSFSGGYQIRLNLAKLLITKPNLLLLDEPTNYLDILSLRWLKNFLKLFQGEVIIITHDRNFMDSVCTHTMGLNRKALYLINGNTHKFYSQLKANDEQYDKEKSSQDKKVKELEEFIAKNKARASTSAQAQSKVKILEKMDIKNSLNVQQDLKFDFSFKQTTTKVLLEVKDISFGYSEDKLLFKNISFNLKKGEVLGIIGKNGKGKSTLLNTLTNELKHLTGEVKYHISSSFGHFGQTNISHLNPKNTIIEEIYLSDSKLAESKVRNICGSMMFTGDSSSKKIALLSGGEKSRVMLAKIIASPVNILFLDEPTNHLDMQSIDALTSAIKNFDGACVIVTHSEELLRNVCHRLIIFSNTGANSFDGTYDEFLSKIGWDEDEVIKEVKVQNKTNYKENKKQRSFLINQRNKETSNLKKEVTKYENTIMAYEDEVQIQQDLLIKSSNNNDNSKIIEISSIIRQKEEKIDELFEKLEKSQNLLDIINESYEEKLNIL